MENKEQWFSNNENYTWYKSKLEDTPIIFLSLLPKEEYLKLIKNNLI